MADSGDALPVPGIHIDLVGPGGRVDSMPRIGRGAVASASGFAERVARPQAKTKGEISMMSRMAVR